MLTTGGVSSEDTVFSTTMRELPEQRYKRVFLYRIIGAPEISAVFKESRTTEVLQYEDVSGY